MNTQHQKAILDYLKDGPKKKSQIVNRFESWYYCNQSKHIGDVLSRMVNSNMIIRVKAGTYELNLNHSINKPKPVTTAPEQLDLFQ